MKNQYYEHMMSKTTHERRQHAVQVAFAVSCLVFVGWLATLSYRFAVNQPSSVANGNANQSQFASAGNAIPTPEQATGLQVVATSSDPTHVDQTMGQNAPYQYQQQ